MSQVTCPGYQGTIEEASIIVNVSNWLVAIMSVSCGIGIVALVVVFVLDPCFPSAHVVSAPICITIR